MFVYVRRGALQGKTRSLDLWHNPNNRGITYLRHVGILYTRRRQPTARVSNVARGTVFSGTLSELKYSNYDLIKN